MPPDEKDETAQTQINESDIETLFKMIRSMDDKMDLFFQGNGRSKLAEIELNKELRKELEDKGIIEMVCENKKIIQSTRKLLYWVLGILGSIMVSGFGGLAWLLIEHATQL